MYNRAHLAQHFAIGNVIFSSYWRSYDRVVGLEFNQYGFSVSVIHCDSTGNPVAGERVRSHSTYPDTKDRVVLVGA